ncbi:MAG: hypothetical protein IJS09_06545 [Treponema sp.]|nr:hypothetical protein [Treponema sp.]
MAGSELSGIERQLVLQYLIDGNTPITVTPVDDSVAGTNGKIKSDSSHIFPVALRAEQMTVLNQGIILLKNPPENIKSYEGKNVRVQFYFNKIGLYFITCMKKVSSGPAIVIPAAIQRVTETVEVKPHPFSAVLYYALQKDGGDLHLDCQFDDAYPLFTPTDRNNAIVRYLSAVPKSDTALQGKIIPPTVLYIDHERIVFGTEKKTISFSEGAEYALKMGFPLPKPLKEREVYVTCMVEQLFSDDADTKCCAVCKYTSIKEEDVRYLSDCLR